MLTFLLKCTSEKIGSVFSVGEEEQGIELQVGVFPVRKLGAEVQFPAWVTVCFTRLELSVWLCVYVCFRRYFSFLVSLQYKVQEHYYFISQRSVQC